MSCLVRYETADFTVESKFDENKLIHILAYYLSSGFEELNANRYNIFNEIFTEFSKVEICKTIDQLRAIKKIELTVEHQFGTIVHLVYCKISHLILLLQAYITIEPIEIIFGICDLLVNYILVNQRKNHTELSLLFKRIITEQTEYFLQICKTRMETRSVYANDQKLTEFLDGIVLKQITHINELSRNFQRF